MKKLQTGYTLIEVMVAVAIVAIVSAVAVPAYTSYVKRGRLTEAFTGLGAGHSAAEQFWANNRTYAGFDAASSFPKAGPNFTFALSNATASAYTLTATGKDTMAGFVYTIDQSGNRTTVSTGDGMGTSTTCWVDKSGGKCTN